MLVMALMICLYEIVERKRVYWIAPLALFGHALMLTHSRGGFLGLMAALSCLLLSRLRTQGRVAGRGGVAGGVSHVRGPADDDQPEGRDRNSRIQLWLDGVIMFTRHPVFGIGSNRYDEFAGHVAHNSFIHSYTELGIVGGTLFLSAFYLAIWPLVRLGRRPSCPGFSRAGANAGLTFWQSWSVIRPAC